jgi:hypothetical protein
MDLFNRIDLFPLLVLGYAEIHYHLPWLYPLYFRRQPEIIADLPHTLDQSRSRKLPLLIIIKDAHLYPITLHRISITISQKNLPDLKQNLDINENIDSPWFSRIYQIDISQFEPDNEISSLVKFQFKCRNKNISVINDNYKGLSSRPFRTWLASKAYNIPPGWFAGDPHYHSNFTSDQVEFGADIKSTRTMAIAQGLSWFFVTDHSYDLDDRLDDYTKNDPNLPKWKMMTDECRQLDSTSCRIIPGEEVSIGNHKNKNVHLLVLNHPLFIAGHGDSAEVWGKNKPQNLLKDIPKLHTEDNLFIAAHPLDKVTLAQKITLNRGNWQLKDYQNANINLLQLINSSDPIQIEKSINIWKKYLLQGEKLFILAGNDAHGNFNIMRQIKYPFTFLFSNSKQIFGKWITIFMAPQNEPLPALKAGRMIVSDGPFLSFNITQLDKIWQIGDTCPLKHGTVEYDARTTAQFGEIMTIYCHRGDLDTGSEFRFPLACPVNIALPAHGYIRLSLITKKGCQAFTNPVFTEHGGD